MLLLSGNKWEQKEYIRHTGYPGGQRHLTATQLHNKKDTRLVENAVRGMLPKNKLGADLFRNLRVYGMVQSTNKTHKIQKPLT